MVETFTAIGSVMKTVIDVAQRVKNRELNEKIIELQSLMFQQQADMARLQADNEALREKNRLHQEAAKLRDGLTYEESFYWYIADGKRDGPFCPNCMDLAGKQVRLTPAHHGFEVFRCHVHGRFYTDKLRNRPIVF